MQKVINLLHILNGCVSSFNLRPFVIISVFVSIIVIINVNINININTYINKYCYNKNTIHGLFTLKMSQ